jgi:hypothetical protein
LLDKSILIVSLLATLRLLVGILSLIVLEIVRIGLGAVVVGVARTIVGAVLILVVFVVIATNNSRGGGNGGLWVTVNRRIFLVPFILKFSFFQASDQFCTKVHQLNIVTCSTTEFETRCERILSHRKLMTAIPRANYLIYY